MISGPQLRAARSWLDWTRAEMAKASGISSETIKNIEMGRFKPHTDTQETIIATLRQHGVELTENDGVRAARSCPNCGWSESNQVKTA